MYNTFSVYNRFVNISNFSINIINYLIDHNETIWKLLKYETNDALSKPNLTTDEKTNLIYSGMSSADNPANYHDIEKEYRIFTKGMSSDAIEEYCSQLHIFLGKLSPQNRVTGRVDMYIQIISHNAILILDNCQNRNEVLLQQIINTLNGATIEGRTQLSFNKENGSSNQARWYKFAEKWYEGYQLVMSCMTSDTSKNAGE